MGFPWDFCSLSIYKFASNTWFNQGFLVYGRYIMSIQNWVYKSTYTIRGAPGILGPNFGIVSPRFGDHPTIMDDFSQDLNWYTYIIKSKGIYNMYIYIYIYVYCFCCFLIVSFFFLRKNEDLGFRSLPRKNTQQKNKDKAP